MAVQGIDVSHWQGAIDWAQVNANPDIGFVVMKATEGGTFVDDQFERNWKACKKPRAAYHFWRYADDPNKQAVNFNAVVRAIAGDVKVRPVFDYEDKNAPKMGNIYSNIKEFHDRAQALFDGRTPLCYTAGWFWDPWIGKDLFGSNPLMVANYPWWWPKDPENPEGDWRDAKTFAEFLIELPKHTGRPVLPKTGGWKLDKVWQFSSHGRVDGIDGDVDLDLFNGTQEDVNAFFYFDAPVVLPPPPPSGVNWDEARVAEIEHWVAEDEARLDAIEAKLAAVKAAL